MEKIIVIGIPGAGKSTFSKRLGSLLNIPVYHLDKYFWGDNMQEMSQNDFRQMQVDLMKEDQWVIDGNFTRSIDLRIKQADTIIFFDFPRIMALWRTIKRFFRYFNKVRPDMGGNNKELLRWKHLKFIMQYPRHEIYETIRTHSQNKRIFIFHNSRQATDFLKNSIH